ncbi:alcohol oxidase [Sarocladium strictum]
MSNLAYDVLIVGGGTAGLVLATRLSEDPAVQVAVIESGDDDSSNPDLQTPGKYHALRNGPLDWGFESTSPAQAGNGHLSMAAGRTLGGTSGINGFVFQPSSRSNLDFWTELGNEGWGFDAMDRAVRRAVTIHGPTGTAPRGSGPIQLVVNEAEIEASWVKIWDDALAEIGYSPCDAFSGSQSGPITNLDTVDPVSKKRSYTKNAYLDPVRSRTNLTVLTGLTVNKVIFKEHEGDLKPMAVGVEVTSNDGKSSIMHARKEVIIAAGVVNSPRILELSGIGGKSLLEKLGIKCIVDNPHVGENCQNHAYSGLVFEVKEGVDTLDGYIRKEPEAVAAAEKTYASGRGGPIGRSSTISSAQMPLTRVTGDDGMADIQRLLKRATGASSGPYVSTSAFQGAWDAYIEENITSDTESPGRFMFVPCYSPFEVADRSYRAPGNHFTIITMLSTPSARWSVHINSSSFEHSNKRTGMSLNVDFGSLALDIEVMARYLMYADKVLSRLEPFASLLKPREERFPDIESARKYVQRETGWAHHYVGTCSMMPLEMGGVVDDNLRVHGCTNLRVCDASIIPVVPRSNPQAVVYGLAEHGADIIKKTMA